MYSIRLSSDRCVNTNFYTILLVNVHVWQLQTVKTKWLKNFVFRCCCLIVLFLKTKDRLPNAAHPSLFYSFYCINWSIYVYSGTGSNCLLFTLMFYSSLDVHFDVLFDRFYLLIANSFLFIFVNFNTFSTFPDSAASSISFYEISTSVLLIEGYNIFNIVSIILFLLCCSNPFVKYCNKIVHLEALNSVYVVTTFRC